VQDYVTQHLPTPAPSIETHYDWIVDKPQPSYPGSIGNHSNPMELSYFHLTLPSYLGFTL